MTSDTPFPASVHKPECDMGVDCTCGVEELERVQAKVAALREEGAKKVNAKIPVETYKAILDLPAEKRLAVALEVMRDQEARRRASASKREALEKHRKERKAKKKIQRRSKR